MVHSLAYPAAVHLLRDLSEFNMLANKVYQQWTSGDLAAKNHLLVYSPLKPLGLLKDPVTGFQYVGPTVFGLL